MTCLNVQQNLSFYLYDELEFAAEEELEEHLAGCSVCQAALADERRWHEALGSEPAAVPMNLLSECREELRESIGIAREARDPLWIRCLDSLGFRSNAWSMRIAMASLLVCLGFGMSRFLERHGLPSPGSIEGVAEAGLFDPSSAHIRSVEPTSDDRVQLVVDEIREHVISGSRDDSRIRRLLVAASKDPTDPGVRVDSVEILKDTEGDDVREALIDSVQHDPNACVRVKALEALARFSSDSTTRGTLISVLSHDQSPDVRTQAIDMLTPARTSAISPQLASVLEKMMHSDPDEYIRMRCQQALRVPHAPVHVY